MRVCIVSAKLLTHVSWGSITTAEKEEGKQQKMCSQAETADSAKWKQLACFLLDSQCACRTTVKLLGSAS